MARGRKRKFEPRYPCGKVKITPEERERRMTPRNSEGELIVEPTPETQARRIAMFGKPAPMNGDVQGELECPIAALGDSLDADQRSAARKVRAAYARYAAAILPPRVVAGQLRDYVQGSGSTPIDSDAAEQAKGEYEQLRRGIRREIMQRFKYNTGRHEIPPGAIVRQALREIDALMLGGLPRNVHALKLGLDAIVSHFDIDGKKRITSIRPPASFEEAA